MCIRDRVRPRCHVALVAHGRVRQVVEPPQGPEGDAQVRACLLYTSDAADERSSVDLGGRRIIKKKKTREHAEVEHVDTENPM